MTDTADLDAFGAVPGVAGHGRLWLYDASLAVLAVVDPVTLVATVHADLGASAAPQASTATDPWDSDPESDGASLVVTRDALWVIRPGELVLVDPWDGSAAGKTRIPVPRGATRWTTDGDAFWATAWPSGDVLQVDAGSGAQRRASVGGHLGELCVSGGTVWVVDRTDETLLGLDGHTLQPRLRVPFDGGRIAPLLAWRGGVVVPHTPGEATGDVDATSLTWVEADGTATRVLRGGAGGSLCLDGDRLWLTSTVEAPVMRRPDMTTRGSGIGIGPVHPEEWPDPVTTYREIVLPQAELGRTVAATGQPFSVVALADRLWVQGYVRSRQAVTLTALDPNSGVIAEVDLSALSQRGAVANLSTQRRVATQRETPDETLERLPGAVRDALTHSGVHVDDRTGERTSVPWLSPKFRLVDVQLEPETYDLWVTFTWADEPDNTFGYVYTADPERPSASTAEDVALELKEDLDTGILRWGDRDTVDGVIWVSRPDDDQAES